MRLTKPHLLYPSLSLSAPLSIPSSRRQARHGPPFPQRQRNLIAWIGRTGAPTPCQSRPAVKTAQAASPATRDPPVEARRQLHPHQLHLTSGLGHVIPVACARRVASRNQDNNDACCALFTTSHVPLCVGRRPGSVARQGNGRGRLRGLPMRTNPGLPRETRLQRSHHPMLSNRPLPSEVWKTPLQLDSHRRVYHHQPIHGR